MVSGNDTVTFNDNSLCKFIGVALYLSLVQLPIEIAFNANIFGIREVMPAWKFRKILACLRWPGCGAVAEVDSESAGSGFLLTQGRWDTEH